MSWGERSCGSRPCHRKPTIETCNVTCPGYKWDGVTPPDSTRDSVSAQEDHARRFFMARHIMTALTPHTIRPRRVARARKYDPCPCGSGKKYKFCCWRKGK